MLELILKNRKIFAYISAAVALIAALYQVKSHIYESGRESMRVEIQAQYNEKLEQQRKEYEKKVERSLQRIQADHAQELERVRNEREIITKVETVTEYVDKEIIVQAECDKLASDVISVLDQATSIVIGSTEAN